MVLTRDKSEKISYKGRIDLLVHPYYLHGQDIHIVKELCPGIISEGVLTGDEWVPNGPMSMAIAMIRWALPDTDLHFQEIE